MGKVFEVTLYEGNEVMAKRDLEKLQKEGWEIAGEITAKFCENEPNRMLIPLKREKVEVVKTESKKQEITDDDKW